MKTTIIFQKITGTLDTEEVFDIQQSQDVKEFI